MKIALIAPTRRSGGSVYSRHLSDALDATTISAELPLRKIRSEVSSRRFEVVDIQLEYRTFGSHLRTLVSLPVLAFMLHDLAATFVTVHGILTRQSLHGQRFRWPKLIAYFVSIRIAALFCNRVLVHTEAMRHELIRYGVRNVTVVPHGNGPLSYYPQTESRNTVLFFGFIRPSKGVDSLIMAFQQVARTNPNASLVIAGDASISKEAAYTGYLIALARRLGLERNVTFRNSFLSEEDMQSLAAKSAVLALPYTDSYLEVSGVLHDFSGYGVSVLCSRTPRFSELTDGFDCIKVGTAPSELGNSITRLLGDIELRESLASNLFRLAQSQSWAVVAKMRLDLYSAVAVPRQQRGK